VVTGSVRAIRFLLPLSTVVVCLAFVFFLTDSSWLLQVIHAMHRDEFSLHRAQDALYLTKLVLFRLLSLSCIVFFVFKRRLGASWKARWDQSFSLAICLVTVSLTLRLWQCPLAVDDSYIDYRYVLHWLSGQFDYNPGTHIMGFTSHLHLIILWAVCFLFHTSAVDLASYYFNCLADTACTVFLFFIVYKVYGRALPAFLAGLVYATSMYACAEVTTGKESPLVNLFILLALWAVQTGRTKLLPWFANALFLLRPEGIIAASFMLFGAFKQNGKAALKTFVVPCSITAAWYVFLFVYFGSILPHGMIAKDKVFFARDYISTLINYLTTTGLMVTNTNAGYLISALGPWPCVISTAIAFIYAFFRLKQPCWVLYRNIALAQLLFLLLAKPVLFSWYFCWLALLAPIVVAQFTADAWPQSAEEKVPPLKDTRIVVWVFMLAYLFTGLAAIPFNWTPYFERGVEYREAALYLLDRTQGKEAIAASDVGIIGYFYPGQIIDMMGLITDQALKYYPVKTDKRYAYLIPPEAVAALKPAYLVAPLSHCQGMLLNDPDFQRNYTELKRWTNPDMMDKVVCIWMRKQEAVPANEK